MIPPEIVFLTPHLLERMSRREPAAPRVPAAALPPATPRALFAALRSALGGR